MENEVRLIDAKFAKHIANKELNSDESGVVQWVLSQTPTIDPESLRPKGWWEEHDTSRYGAPAYVCSRCYDIWESIQIKNMKYCPSCGAKMEG